MGILNSIKLLFAAVQAGYYVAKSMWTERHRNYAAVYCLIPLHNQWEEALVDELFDKQEAERSALQDKFAEHRKSREELQNAN